MKKIIVLASSAALLLAALIIGNFVAADEPILSNSTSMTIEEFTDRYVGTPSESEADDAISSVNAVGTPGIKYSHIFYDPETRKITFDAALSEGDEVSELNAEGILYSSYKADHGINSIVGDLEDTTGQYEILRFEIYNDNDLSFLYAINTPETAATPTLLMYLLKGDKLYLLETSIPSAMSDIVVPNTPDCKTKEGNIDGFWFVDIIAPTGK